MRPARTFEIGPGTGTATGRLLALGAKPLVVIESDARLASFLASKYAGSISIVNAPFEDAKLEAASFSIGTAATSFHWLDQPTALAKVATLLRRDGWWATWWNIFGDPARHDASHEATKELLKHQPNSPTHAAGKALPFALDRAARLADIASCAEFAEAEVEIRKWTLTLSPPQVRALYATYSQFSVLEAKERERILDELERIADREFAGRVERNMCTALYIALRR